MKPIPPHVPHCLAMNGDWVCNRDAGHTGAHETRSDRGSGCIGWRPEAEEMYYQPPDRAIVPAIIAGVLADVLGQEEPVH